MTDVDLARWLAKPTGCELAAMDRLSGPALDIGCGPGRHVLALNARGVECLGIDVLPTAVLSESLRYEVEDCPDVHVATTRAVAVALGGDRPGLR